MMAVTAMDIGLPPSWNVAVMQIQVASMQKEPCDFPLDLGRFHYQAGNAQTTVTAKACCNMALLGWTQREALETYLRLQTFAEDWDAPGMEAYDEL